MCPTPNIISSIGDYEIDVLFKESNVLCLQDLANQNILSEELVAKLKNFLAGYIEWLKEVIDEVIDEKSHNARERIIARIENAVKRIRAGIDLLGNDKTVRLAFSMANSVMLRQMIHSGKKYSGSERERDQGQYSKPKYEAPDYKKYADDISGNIKLEEFTQIMRNKSKWIKH